MSNYQPGNAIQSKVSQRFVMMDATFIKDAFAPSNASETFNKRISWNNSYYSLDSAKLTIKANNYNVSSGAAFISGLNLRELKPRIEWHATETGEKEVTYDVTDILLNGENVLKSTFSVSNYHVLAASCDVFAELLVIWIKLEGAPDDPHPGDEGNIQDKNAWNKFVDGVKGNLKTIVIIATIVGTVTAVAYAYKTASLTNILSAIRRK